MQHPPVVHTDAGRVRGRWSDGCAVFLGTPYAQPPVGDLRFAAPVAREPWDGVRDATAPGATSQSGATGVTLIPEPSVEGDDVLNVNVFTPEPGPGAALPVLVYLHGGGYVSGSIASPWYRGESFARDGVVTVTVAYRVGFDGFGWVDGGASNRGVRDWLLALEWVQRNIAAFGGDANRVTLAGQSAGGGGVLTLLAMPRAQGLFRHAWCMSPTAVTVGADEARMLATAVARAAGLDSSSTHAFGTVPRARLTELIPDPLRGGLRALRAGLDGGIPNIGPTIDGELIERSTLDALAAGIGGDTPLVVGGLDDEFTMIADDLPAVIGSAPRPLLFEALGLSGARRRGYLAANDALAREGTRRLVGRFISDTTMRRDVVRAARARNAASAATWVYAFSWRSPTMHWALHCLDVPFFFDVLDAEGVSRIAGARPPGELASAYHGAAVAYVRTGAAEWTPWSWDSPARIFTDPAPSPDEESGAPYAGLLPLL
ncbi:carboxylic ester hydrolase [Pseudoclavibacter endophyticus]|uniref:Carboxylic ester hydrolase n=1 Tax=Pseudoclavibacter endophyticus TaxID=1778590 RepID=A0A6H9WMI2_9MICO|nr:carboxylesterase family protein [Pseudoclavibacter endophyticus]KAB1647878.1 carboxylesterase family protein [Pseudoclavibacter endophyticus]GGA73555.1 carboxylic ester hydrolase [Pseudoclavibacter endophyticus]